MNRPWRALAPIVSLILTLVFAFSLLDLFGLFASDLIPKEDWHISWKPIGQLITLASAIVTVITAYRAVLFHLHEKVIDTLISAKGSDGYGGDTDILRRVLHVRLGRLADDLLPPDRNFPLALLPGGDVALIMDQADYGDILKKLLRQATVSKPKWKVRWITFVPFESLNKGLAYNDTIWRERLKDGPKGIGSCEKNYRYYDFVHSWSTLKGGQQLIVLANPNTHSLHPQNWRKYLADGQFCLDLVKYLAARYDWGEPLNRREGFVAAEERDFLKSDLRNQALLKDKDEQDSVRWIALDKVEASTPNQTSSLYGLDFVYFSVPKIGDLCIARADPSNYLETSKGGVIGTTFLILSTQRLDVYSELFSNLWRSACRSFVELSNAHSNLTSGLPRNLNLEKQVKKAWDVNAAQYLRDDTRRGDDSKQIAQVAEILHKEKNNKPSIYYAGVGPGELLTKILKTNLPYSSIKVVDFCGEMIKLCKERKPPFPSTVHIKKEDFLHYNNKDDSYDLILILNNTLGNLVMESSGEVARNLVLMNFHGMLKGSGILFISVYDRFHSTIEPPMYTKCWKLKDMINEQDILLHLDKQEEPFFYSHLFDENE